MVGRQSINILNSAADERIWPVQIGEHRRAWHGHIIGRATSGQRPSSTIEAEAKRTDEGPSRGSIALAGQGGDLLAPKLAG